MKCRFSTSTRGVVILCTLLGVIVAVLTMRRRTVATVDVVNEDSTTEFERSELVRDAPDSSSWRSVGSLGSALCIGSIGSFFSIASVASAASIGSFAGIGTGFSSRAIAGTSRRT
jgi:hypothetical protein